MNNWPPPTGEPSFVPYTIDQVTMILDSFALVIQSQSKHILAIANAIQGLSTRIGDLEVLAVQVHAAKASAPTSTSDNHQGMYL